MHLVVPSGPGFPPAVCVARQVAGCGRDLKDEKVRFIWFSGCARPVAYLLLSQFYSPTPPFASCLRPAVVRLRRGVSVDLCPVPVLSRGVEVTRHVGPSRHRSSKAVHLANRTSALSRAARSAPVTGLLPAIQGVSEACVIASGDAARPAAAVLPTVWDLPPDQRVRRRQAVRLLCGLDPTSDSRCHPRARVGRGRRSANHCGRHGPRHVSQHH